MKAPTTTSTAAWGLKPRRFAARILSRFPNPGGLCRSYCHRASTHQRLYTSVWNRLCPQADLTAHIASRFPAVTFSTHETLGERARGIDLKVSITVKPWTPLRPVGVSLNAVVRQIARKAILPRGYVRCFELLRHHAAVAEVDLKLALPIERRMRQTRCVMLDAERDQHPRGQGGLTVFKYGDSSYNHKGVSKARVERIQRFKSDHSVSVAARTPVPCCHVSESFGRRVCTMNELLPDNLAGWVGIGATLVGAMWAIITFHRGNRIKAAEILIEIEEAYGRHLPTLLELEYMKDYERVFKGALQKSVQQPPGYTKVESDAIDRLEAALRHFLVCASVRRLGVDAGMIDRLCGWYLRILVNDTEGTTYKRPELREYVRCYWPSIFFWAPLAPAPWPKRIVIVLFQMPERLKYWWNGSWALPPQGASNAAGSQPTTGDAQA